MIDGTGTTSYSGPPAYEHAVLHQLHRIHHSQTGKAVFHEFAGRTHKKMRIIPLEGVLNAYAAPSGATNPSMTN